MPQDLVQVIQQAFNGFSIGLVYALVALGITLVFGLTRLVNFAHGELVMIGAMVVAATDPTGDLLQFLFACVLAIGALAIISLFTEVVLFRPTLSSPMNGFLVSLGLILVLQGLAIQIWEPYPRTTLPVFKGVLEVDELRFAWQRIAVIGISLASVLSLFVFLSKHRLGKGIRAMSDDMEAASLMGVPNHLLIALTFVIGGVLAAVASASYASLFPSDPFLGTHLVIKGFAVALLGGLGQPMGALIAGVLLGIAETVASTYFLTEWKDGLAFLVMFVVLLVRPRGLIRGARGRGL
jgi:branched-chain amino acid transport system permease protein